MNYSKLLQRTLQFAFAISFNSLIAQNYNITYGFTSPYQNSIHTCGYQITNGLIVEGGTIQHPTSPTYNVVELGRVNKTTGNMLPSPYYYSPGTNLDHVAVDLIESSTNPNQVIVLSRIYDPTAGQFLIGLFKTNPATGATPWFIYLGLTPIHNDFFPTAIDRDGNGNYFILGHAHNVLTGNREIYMASVTDLGVVNWEQHYVGPSPLSDDFESVDLTYDATGPNLILTANYSNPAPNGFVVLDVNPLNGAYVNSRHVNMIQGTNDIYARDMEYINGNYVIVGQLRAGPFTGFLVQYTPGLTPFVPFSQAYTTTNGAIFMTGVKPSGTTPPDMYASYEYHNSGMVVPGIVQLNSIGNWINGFTYNVQGFKISKGLISVDGDTSYVHKGANNSSSLAGISALSLVGTITPLVSLPPILCDDPLPATELSSANEVAILFTDSSISSDWASTLLVSTTSGTMWDCTGGIAGFFKLAAPTSILEVEATTQALIFPNPASEQISIQLTENDLARYNKGKIMNALGQSVIDIPIIKSTMKINVADLSPGIYFFQMYNEGSQVSNSQRIVIN